MLIFIQRRRAATASSNLFKYLLDILNIITHICEKCIDTPICIVLYKWTPMWLAACAPPVCVCVWVHTHTHPYTHMSGIENNFDAIWCEELTKHNID